MKEGREKAMNMSKTAEVFQGPDESPASFMSVCARPSICKHPLPRKPLKNQRMISIAFVGQAQGDIGENCRSWRDSLE
jgi:hypothetical protein